MNTEGAAKKSKTENQEHWRCTQASKKDGLKRRRGEQLDEAEHKTKQAMLMRVRENRRRKEDKEKNIPERKSNKKKAK